MASGMKNPSARILMETQASHINKDPSFVIGPWNQIQQHGPRSQVITPVTHISMAPGGSPDHRHPHVVTQATNITRYTSCSGAMDPVVALGSRT